MKTIIGVMGGGASTPAVIKLAEELGRAIAAQGWILLTGGRRAGVMHAASRGAASACGTVIGVLPGADWSGASEFVELPILTGMGSGRNLVNVLSSRAVAALPGGSGTLSEIALALKHGRPVLLLGWERQPLAGYQLRRFDDVASLMEALRKAVSAAPPDRAL